MSRGQAMVEFALILPLLALLLVMAIDFGRVFFGWVGVHNAARIAANAAASNPDAWSPPTITTGQDAYRRAVLNDLRALNCERPGGGSWTTADIPAPTFENKPTGFSLADTYEVGDHALVSLTCEFDLITPLAGAILGSPISISAEAEFMVRGGLINGLPVGPAPPPPGCVDRVVPNLIGLSVAGARTAWTTAGFTGGFTPATGVDSDIVTGQTTSPSSLPNDCLVATASVTVTHAAPGPCTAPELQVPNLVGLTVSQARSTWSSSGFTGTFTPASGSNTNIVSAQVTDPTSSAGDCVDETTEVTVTHAAPPPPQCTMPQLFGVRANSAAGVFNGPPNNFTGAVTITRPPSGNYLITAQSLVAGQQYDCSSSVVVSAP